MPAVGREQLYLSVSEGAGSSVGALCLLLGSRVGARGQCIEPSACWVPDWRLDPDWSHRRSSLEPRLVARPPNRWSREVPLISTD